MVVIHYTAMDSAAEAIERLCDPEFEVSAHYLIDSDGTITQLVSEELRAWHAGAGAWGDVTDVNSHSIGIELDYCPPFEGILQFDPRQMQALQDLLTDILQRHPEITPESIIGHSDMAPGRKVDPGPRFDWRRLALRGLALWPGVAGPGAFDEDLAAIGYRLPEGAEAGLLLAAFRMRCRRWARGRLSGGDRQAARALAARVG